MDDIRTPINLFFDKVASGLEFTISKNGELEADAQFVVIKWGTEIWKNLKDSLFKCYKEVFGDGDIWGESAFCRKCKRKLALNEYAYRLASRNFICSDSCDGIIVEFYPITYLEEKIKKEINSEKACCSLYLNKQNVTGFTWGQVCTLADICFNVYNSYYSSDFLKASEVSKLLLGSMEKFGILPTSNIFYAYELGIHKRKRGGIQTIVNLSTPLLKLAQENNIENMLFKTHRKSPMWKVGILLGFIEVFRSSHEDQTSYMCLPNVNTLLKVFQGSSSEEIAKFMEETKDLYLKDKTLYQQK